MKIFIFSVLITTLLIGSGCAPTDQNQTPTVPEHNYEYLWLFPKDYTVGDTYDISSWNTYKPTDRGFTVKIPADFEPRENTIPALIEGVDDMFYALLGPYVLLVQTDPLGLTAQEFAEQIFPEAEITSGQEAALWHPVAGELLKKFPNLDMVYANDISVDTTDNSSGLEHNKNLCISYNGRIYMFEINRDGLVDDYDNLLKYTVSQMQTF